MRTSRKNPPGKKRARSQTLARTRKKAVAAGTCALSMKGALKKSAALEVQLKLNRRQFVLLREVGMNLTMGASLDKTLESLTAKAAEFFQADAVECMLWDDEHRQLERRAGFGFLTDPLQMQPIPRELIQRYLDAGQEYVVLPNLAASPFNLKMNLIAKENFVSALAVTLNVNGTVLGLLIIYSRGRGRNFTLEEIENARLFASEAAVAVSNVQLLTELKAEVQIANTLLKVAEDIGTLGSLDEVLNRIVTIITHVLEFRVCAVFLWEKEKNFFMPAKATGVPPHRSPFFHTLVLHAKDMVFTSGEKHNRSVLSALDHPQRFPIEKLAGVLGYKDLLFVPLVIKDQLLGTLVGGGLMGKVFDSKDILFLRGIAAQAAIAIDDANLFDELERSFWDTIKSLAAAIEAKDHYTHDHSEAVIQYGARLAEELNLTPLQQELMKKACLLHDVGKIGVEDGILRKEAPLTHDERLEIEKHPVIGQEILSSVRSLAEVSRIIRHHHERYDGNGYPDRLKGEDIPLLSRILQIADSFDAMTSDRPYRKALTQDEAIAELKNCSGKQFDPHIVGLFIRILQRAAFKQNSNWS
jgi:putative nucleotidyltransferase with HDIG domain